MPIDKSKITKEMLEKALHCNTPEELIALAKAEGIDITKEEAEAYLAELADFELNSDALDKVAGGSHFVTDSAARADCGGGYSSGSPCSQQGYW